MNRKAPREVAAWLINKINSEGELHHRDAVNHIEKKFGHNLLKRNQSGKTVLSRDLKKAFNDLKGDQIEWDIGKQSWVMRSGNGKQDRLHVKKTKLHKAVQAQPVPPDASYDHPSLYFNRELGWLDFNWRVLHQAADPRIPLMERVRFVAITASNLDEFVQKRLGGLKRQKAADVHELTPDGRTPEDQIKMIQDNTYKMQDRLLEIWHHELQPDLESKAGLFISDYEDLNRSQKDELNTYFNDHIYPVLTPLAVDPGHPFPFISNLSLSMAVILHHPETGSAEFARVKIPSNLPRFIRVSDETVAYRLVPVEQVVKNNIQRLFRGMKIDEVFIFRVTRNADIRREEEEADDLLSMISEELRERRFAPVVRLEAQESANQNALDLLIRELDISGDDLYKVNGMLDLSDCFELEKLDLPDFNYEKWNPVVQNRLHIDQSEEVSIFKTIREGDIMVHHPYDSFKASVQRLIEEAADDPMVIAIKLTLYRTSDDSPIVKALTRAAEKGKQVAVLVEVKARFDEANNIEWGKLMENSGIHVTYGLVGLKTHAKVALIIREEQTGPRTYCHISTGNYHVETAGIYTDLGLLTCNPDLGHDAINMFHYLTGHAPEQEYKKMIVAPLSMRERFYDLILQEVESHKKYGNGRIVAKMNALDDIEIIRHLYEASGEGVKIDLIVRGHCRLRPGVNGISENINVISIIGRFLEHDRIFYFHNNGDPKLFMGSADWRHRNLSERVEGIIPIENSNLKRRLIYILKHALKDNRLAWDMKSDGSYEQRKPPAGKNEHNYHEILMKDALKRSNKERTYTNTKLP